MAQDYTKTMLEKLTSGPVSEIELSGTQRAVLFAAETRGLVLRVSHGPGSFSDWQLTDAGKKWLRNN